MKELERRVSISVAGEADNELPHADACRDDFVYAKKDHSMTNRFYTESFTAGIGQLAQSSVIDAQFRAIESGFGLIQAAIDDFQGLAGITDLRGFPASFSGQAGKYAVVNTAESSLEFVSGGRLALKTIAGTSYELLATDAGKLLIFTNASAIASDGAA